MRRKPAEKHTGSAFCQGNRRRHDERAVIRITSLACGAGRRGVASRKGPSPSLPRRRETESSAAVPRYPRLRIGDLQTCRLAPREPEPPMERMTIAEATVASLIAHGLETIYALPGVHNDP